MVNTRQSTLEFLGLAFDEAVQRVVNALLSGLTAQITNELRQNGTRGSGDQPPTIHTWLERFGKQKPRTFSSATTLVDVENLIAHIEKLFEVLGYVDEFKARLESYRLKGDALSWWKAFKQAKGGEEYRDGEPNGEFMKRFLRLSGFLGKKASTQEEQAKNFKWALCDWILDGIVNTKFTDVAQVANAARNIEILRERTGQNNKRNRDRDRIWSTAQGSSQRGYDQKRHDGRGYDRHGSNQREYDQKGYDGRSYDMEVGNGNHRSWRDRDQQDQGRQYNHSSGSSNQKGLLDYASSPRGETCGKLHPGKACYRVTGAFFSCGSTGHMARDCPKNDRNGGEGSGNDKQAATKGCVFDSTTNHAASASGSVWMHPRAGCYIIHKAIQSHNAECREEAQAEKQEYIDLVDTLVRTIIREEVKTQLPQILPKVVLDFATPVIGRNVTETLEAAVLAKSSSQPKFTYEAAASLSEYELTKILLDKIVESKSHLRANYKRKLYDALIKIKTPPLDQTEGRKRRKSSKEAESPKDLRSKEGKSLSSSKGTSHSHHKSSGKSAHAKEPSQTIDDSRVQKNQEFDTDNNDEQPDDEVASKNDWFKKPKRPPTPDPDWNKRQHVDFRPAQTWISVTTRAEKPPTSFDELIDTPIDFSAFPLPLILDHRGRQLIPRDYFINNDLEYLKGGSLSRQYSTSVTKTKAATYEINWIEDMVPNLWSPIKVVYDKHAYWGHLDEIEVRREDQQLYTFKEGVESYQKKLNLTKPETFRSNLRNRTAYTAYSDPQGVIYKDQNNRNRLMRTNGLHKFSNGTLNDVRTALYDIASGIRMEYLLQE
ncbi:zinc finger, CCHC-type, retrotransposon gag domain protein [Tanacetum coccineum]